MVRHPTAFSSCGWIGKFVIAVCGRDMILFHLVQGSLETIQQAEWQIWHQCALSKEQRYENDTLEQSDTLSRREMKARTRPSRSKSHSTYGILDALCSRRSEKLWVLQKKVNGLVTFDELWNLNGYGSWWLKAFSCWSGLSKGCLMNTKVPVQRNGWAS